MAVRYYLHGPLTTLQHAIGAATAVDGCGLLVLQALLNDLMAMTRAESETASSDSSQTQQDGPHAFPAALATCPAHTLSQSATPGQQQFDAHSVFLQHQAAHVQLDSAEEPSGDLMPGQL